MVLVSLKDGDFMTNTVQCNVRVEGEALEKLMNNFEIGLQVRDDFLAAFFDLLGIKAKLERVRYFNLSWPVEVTSVQAKDGEAMGQ